MISALLASAIVLASIGHLAFLVRRRRSAKQLAHTADRSAVATVVADAADISNGTAGVTTWAGTWNGQRVQIRTIVDTLATRKLPALWLCATITEPVAVPGILDVMVRPGGPTTFSNFDLLPHTLPPAPGLPGEAVIRTDLRGARFPVDTIAEHAGVFTNPQAKELLLTPNGIRIVWLVAEANRARYGVFRQADFGRATFEPALIESLLAIASALREAINRKAPEA